MFYSPIILTKKGPLGKIWLAAHLQHKLSKTQVFSTDVVAACEQLQSPELSFALRLSSNLLLGIVRIYSRKAHYLFIDSREALNKLQLVFQGNTVDLAPGTTVAPYSAITMEGVDDTSQLKREESSKKSSKRSRYELDRFSETSSILDIDMLLDMDTDMACTLSSSEFRWNETAQSLSRFRARPEDITLPPVDMDFIYQMPDAALEHWDDHEMLHRETVNMNLTPLSARASLQSPEVLRRESRGSLSGRISLERLSGVQGNRKEQDNSDWNFSMEMDADSVFETSPNFEQRHETSFPLDNTTGRGDSILLQESPLPLEINQQEQNNAKKRKTDSNTCIFAIDRNSEISAKTLKRHLSDTKDLRRGYI
ncbi:Sister chromatid cohesion 1 protein 4 [Galdieria sulphuraria]|nr:Sister chromatid cohesion 1 protein 4 [Galdieria sulphuraria]